MMGIIINVRASVVRMTVALAAVCALLFAVPNFAYALEYSQIDDYQSFMEDTDIYINRSSVNWTTADIDVNSSAGIALKNFHTISFQDVDGTTLGVRSEQPSGRAIFYTGDATGRVTIANPFQVRYQRVAVTEDGQVCDLIVKCTSLTLDANTQRNQDNEVTRVTQSGSEGYNLFGAHDHNAGDYYMIADEAHPGYYKWAPNRSFCHVTHAMQVYCVRAGTNTRVPGRFTMYMFDLDTPDSASVPAAYSTQWAESLQLRSGFSDVAISKNTVLDTSRVAADNMFMATTGTGNLNTTPSIWDSGVVVRTDSNGVLNYTWRSGGTGIATSLGFGMPGTVLGGFSFQKVDADRGVFSSQGNAKINTAKFGVYADEACTKKLLEMTVGASGVVSTGKSKLNLANNPYYVKELSATGYDIDHDVWMFVATKNGG